MSDFASSEGNVCEHYERQWSLNLFPGVFHWERLWGCSCEPLIADYKAGKPPNEPTSKNSKNLETATLVDEDSNNSCSLPSLKSPILGNHIDRNPVSESGDVYALVDGDGHKEISAEDASSIEISNARTTDEPIQRGGCIKISRKPVNRRRSILTETKKKSSPIICLSLSRKEHGSPLLQSPESDRTLPESDDETRFIFPYSPHM
jgi:hypothetical protein